ncbi:hypothetical protein ACI782_05255 [Geodermatophilus sp. SYSU D00703]
MRTYDPADRIVYVHLAQDPAAPPAPRDECRQLPSGYANASLSARLGAPHGAGVRPALVVLPGGSAPTDGPASPAPVLRLAR